MPDHIPTEDAAQSQQGASNPQNKAETLRLAISAVGKDDDDDSDGRPDDYLSEIQ